MKAELEKQIEQAVKELFKASVQVELERPDEKFGDYATNIALQLAKKVGHNPREVAESLATKLQADLKRSVSEVSVAGPGFINLKLNDRALVNSLDTKPAQSLAGKTIVAECSDPNPFKVLHAGHLYTSLVGDAVVRLMEKGGANIKRVNFGGDVGLHVGKALWSVIKELGGEHPDKLSQIADNQKLDWISQHYVAGNAAYDEDETAKSQIDDLNLKVYQLHDKDDHNSALAKIYWTCRQWSYEGFENLYKQLQIKPFDKYYPESLVADAGLQAVREHTGSVYQQSDGAVIFRGEDYGLFTQVFITSEGLPTYAAKDVGLIYHKQADFAPDQSFIFTDVAQKDHLAVVLKSISLFAPELVEATTHFTHGQIKLAGGVKMSSRQGNIVRADDILNEATRASKKLHQKESPDAVLGAVKYAFLKTRIGSDIIYDPEESVSLEGNSGPYLQYAHARARSIIAKADGAGQLADDLQPGERSLARKLGEYAETLDKATVELMPHHVCGYLYELSQTFNRFYEQNRVIGDDRQPLRLGLVKQYADTLKAGLKLLGIPAPDKM